MPIRLQLNAGGELQRHAGNEHGGAQVWQQGEMKTAGREGSDTVRRQNSIWFTNKKKTFATPLATGMTANCGSKQTDRRTDLQYELIDLL